MAKCKNRGCRRVRRSKSLFCSRHMPTVEPNNVPATRRPAKTTSRTLTKVKPGYVGQFIIPANVLAKIHVAVSHFKHELIERNEDMITGQRKLFHIPTHIAALITPCLNKIVELSRSQGFPIKKAACVTKGASLVLAPEVNGRSNSWTRGLIHRDFSDVNVTGIYSFSLCLDKVTLNNGAVRIWPTTQHTPYDPRHPKNSIKHQHYKDLTGEEGEVWMWDARLLHQSLPNSTKEKRCTLHFYVHNARDSITLSN